MDVSSRRPKRSGSVWYACTEPVGSPAVSRATGGDVPNFSSDFAVDSRHSEAPFEISGADVEWSPTVAVR